ncbi:MAG: glycosyltransferase [Candidatus Saccharicenans sp.]|jgi:ceramide glucosyltransferase|nr:glycosyltransferase [Candidatus Saccharicenans sp.]MDH7493656.1 glycosyltransferase [Candidatus Saccharicenans sp.]
MKTLFIISLLISGLYLVILTIMTVIHRPRPNRSRGNSSGKNFRAYPPVSILKPIKGVDDDLEANLESFYQLDYPVYEILYAVDDWQDKAVEIIRKVSEHHPRIRTKILATGHHPTDNPKIHKLDFMEKESFGRLLWAVDANVRVEPDTLRRLADEYLEGGARLVFSPVLGTGSRSLASLMENTSLNFFTSGNVIALWKLFSQPVVVGKSMLIDRVALRTFGGFSYIKDYLAEDYILSKSFVDSGFKVSTNFIWVTNINQRTTFRGFYKRMARWARLRYQLHRPAYLLEILLNPVIMALAGLVIFGKEFWPLALAAVSGKIFLEYFNFLAVNRPDRRQLVNHLMFPLMVLWKDIILFSVYLAPFFSTWVDWRGGRIKVGRNSLIYHPGRLEKLAYEEV